MFLPEGFLLETKENLHALSTPAHLQQAITDRRILEAKAILCDANHNLWVQFPWGKGFLPRTEGALGVEEGTTRDIALISRVNRPICFIAQELTTDEQGNPLAILSRRQAQHRCRKEYLNHLQAGEVINIRITHLEPFGAFCDVGCGISSFIPVDAISVSRIFHPKERFKVGQKAKAVVKGVEPDGKIHLTHKELLGSWAENAAMFQVGETVSGIIRTVESYGSFVELTPNLAGLAEPKEGVIPGQHAAVFIKNIIPEKMKIKLIIVDSFDEPSIPTTGDYFFQGDSMTHWRYSPMGAVKTIETFFDITQ
jgi:small subunit ribosomal protein S1